MSKTVQNKNSQSAAASGREQFLTRTIVVWAGALICCLLWGSAFPCVKLGYAWSNINADDTSSLILFAGMRFTLAGILTILFASLIGKHAVVPRSAAAMKKIVTLSLFQTVLQYLFFYIGLAHASGVNASIIEGTNVFVAILIAGLIFHLEQVTARKMIGCVIGFAGVVLVNLSGGSLGGLSWNGEGFIFLSTVAYAFSSVIMKRYSKEESPVMLSGWQFIAGGLIMVIWGVLSGGRVEITAARAGIMLLYLAFISACAYTIWGTLLKYNPVSKVAVFGFMNPVFGVILSAILLSEADSLGISAIGALVLVCIGIYVCNSMARTSECS